MKGKDLINYIQEKHLEDFDFPIMEPDGNFNGYISIEQASHEYDVPAFYIRKMIREGKLETLSALGRDLIKREEADVVIPEEKNNAILSMAERFKEHKRLERRKNYESERQRAN